MTLRQIRIGLNILLTALFLLGLAGMFVPRVLHEWGGYLLMCAALLHIGLNRSYFQSLGRGKMTPTRTLNLVSIVLFGAAMLFLLISGLNLTNVIRLPDPTISRSLHMGAAITATVLLFLHLSLHLRRYVRGKRGAAAIVGALLLAAAGIAGLPYLDRWYHVVHVSRAEIVPGEHVAGRGRILTVYFGRVGNTDLPPNVDAVSGASVMLDGDTILGNAEMLALMAQDAAGGDLLAIRTEKIYPAEYVPTTQEARAEFDADEFPALKEIAVNPEDYDTIILIFPLWWDRTPMAVASFLRPYDLSGKRIIPIVTHGGGGLGAAVETLRTYTNADVREGLDVYSSDVPSARQTIADYLKKNANE